MFVPVAFHHVGTAAVGPTDLRAVGILLAGQLLIVDGAAHEESIALRIACRESA